MALLAFVDDPGVNALIPALGFRQTLPGGAGWADLLRRARAPGRHHGVVWYPTARTSSPALAITEAGVTLVLLGEDFDARAVESMLTVAPLLGSLLRAEYEASTARGELRVAREHTRHAENMAAALDAARMDVERSVAALHSQAGELQLARARAEEAGQAKDEFLAMLGHELRNPLSPIVTALHLMRLNNQHSREQDIIERQVSGLVRLVDDLLDVSRITRGKLELRKKPVEFVEVASRATETASAMIENKRQILEFDIPAGGLVIDADPARLSQAFANLLTNASKYSEVGTRIVFSAKRRESSLYVRVKDEGIGLTDGMQDRIFESFVQDRQSLDRAQGGLGLGLAIVRSLVLLHGGMVAAHSDGEGRGSEFVVELPLAADRVVHPESPKIADATFTPGRVLVVDDNEDANALLSETLIAAGHDVRAAADGPTALEIAKQFRPHVALLDIGLPVMDGYELAKRLLDAMLTPRPRLVAVTGYGQAQDKARSLAAGFDAHLVKPLALETLLDVLQKLRDPSPSPELSKNPVQRGER